MQSPQQVERRTEDLEGRVDRIERTLPTLATKRDLKASEERMRKHVSGAVEASEGRMRKHVSGAIETAIEASEGRMRKHVEGVEERLRTHFNVVAEDLRHNIQLVAEAVATLAASRH